MAEVLARFADPLATTDGSRYVAQACGAANADGLWEGWIEFVPVDGGQPVRSPRETTQPNRTDAEYWATGLTAIYLEGALDRALNRPVKKIVPPAQAMFDQPAPAFSSAAVPRPGNDAVLDPFSVYDKSETLLRQALGALSAWHLVNIVLAYRLSEQPVAVLNTMPAAALAELIIAQVRASTPAR